MREDQLRRPLLAAVLFVAGYVVAQDVAQGGPIAVSLIVSAVIWLTVAFG